MSILKNTTLVVIPAWNEQESISEVVSKIQSLAFPLDILVIDDGSSDNTALRAREKKALVVSLPFNLGYGAALQTGFIYAVDNNYDYLIHLDADGQHDPSSLPALFKEIKESDADIVIGSRFLKNSAYLNTFSRKIGVYIFRSIIKLITKQDITDPTSGFQALKRKAFKLYSEIYPSDFPDADVIIASYFCSFKIKEIPVKIYPKPSGKSMHS